ncbi:RNA polymerase sigma factor [Halalkalibacterium halodurans]|uniref:RNA polymerase sigma factor n=1 Tax=Halalkalibacterium halodurans TaxID=86665 RepID=UPI002AAA47E7|nr:RNA polymerase sigma factor [Halalkalibacterium halodurans]MDY7221214.1 RNA polymerase sigma factor [Halalkalibacterium halodurans]MDY7240453.1 RNA polymerase sigma factor [Halalkalibacterium halodurans]
MHKQLSHKFKVIDESKIYEEYYQSIYQTAKFIVDDSFIAQDITQETFEKAFRNISRVKDSDKLGRWILKIAKTTSFDYLRKKARRNEFPMENLTKEIENINNNIQSPEIFIESDILKEIIIENILKLKPEYRDVIILKYYHELKDEEISKLIGISLYATKSRLQRAKTRLRKSLEDLKKY